MFGARIVLISLVLINWVALPTAQTSPEPEPGEAIFNIFIRAVPVGLERVEVERTQTGWSINSTGRLTQPFNLLNRNFEMHYDSNWIPVELTIDAVLQGQPYSLHTTFSGNSAVSEIQQGGETSRQSTSVSTNTLVLPNNFFASYEALAARLSTTKPGDEFPVYIAPHGEVRVRVDSFSEDRIQTSSATINMRRYNVTFLNPESSLETETWTELPLETEIWTDDRHRLLRITSPSTSIDVAREDIVAVSSRLETVRHDGDESVRVLAAGFSLAATITTPVDQELPPNNRWPAVLLVPGSNSVDRDERMSGIPVFGQMAIALADAGFMVARYDKRGVGQTGGRTETANLDDYAEDVRVMVRYLEKRRDVDKNRIVVIGHGEGGWIAMLAASKENKISGLVLIATPATNGADLVLEQQQLMLNRSQISESDRKTKIDLQRRIHEAVTSGEGWDDIPDDLRRQANTSWFKSFLSFDPSDVIRKIRQPIFIVQGSLDQQILPHHADRLANLARARQRNRRYRGVDTFTQMKLFDGINHSMVQAVPEKTDETKILASKNVSPTLISTVAEWFSKILPAPRG